MVDGVLGEERLVEHVVLGPADRAQDRGRPELAGRRQVLLGQDPLHQLLLVVRVVDHEPPVEPDRLAVAAQHPRAQRVERPRLDVLAVLADERLDPLAELARGAVGERHGQDPPGLDGLDADQVRDPVGDDARLARARAREDQQRALGRGDGPRLLGVEAADDLLGAGGAPGLDRRRDRLRVERRARGRELRLHGARRAATRAPRGPTRASPARRSGAARRRRALAGSTAGTSSPRSSHVPCSAGLGAARAAALRGLVEGVGLTHPF